MSTTPTCFPATLLLLALGACGGGDTFVESGDAEDLDIVPAASEPATSEGDEVAAPIRQAMAEIVGLRAFGDAEIHGVVSTPDGGAFVYLFASVDDVETLIGGATPDARVDGVVVGRDGACLGVLPDLSLETLADPDGAEPCPDELPAPFSLELEAAALSLEAQEYGDEVTEAPAPPSSCSAACGADDGLTYATKEAMSNGGSTGTGSACGGTGTYGYLYQCVEYTERVAGRSDWAGNAYPGYWSQTGLSSSSSSQGPYYKGLLPLGTGTSYAAPLAGDVIVWSGGSYGHVGIAASVGSSTVTVYDQNRRCGDQSCTLSYSPGGSYSLSNGSSSGYCGAEGISSYTLKGWLRRGWDFGGTYGLASSSSTGASTHNWWPNDASYVSGTTSGSVSDISDYITINPGTTDPYITSPAGLAIPAYSSSATYGYRYLNVYMKSDCSNKSAQLFWKRTTDSGFDATRSVNATLSGSGWQTVTFSAGSDSDWSGTIDQIRIDPASSCSSSSSDTISFAYAYFTR